MKHFKEEYIVPVSKFAHSNYIAICSTLLALVVFALMSWHRARRSDLKAAGMSDKNGGLWAFRFNRDIFLLRFSREISETNIRSKFPWLKDKFKTSFVIAVERNWPRYLFLPSYFQIIAETFPHKVFPGRDLVVNEWSLLVGIDGLKRRITLDLYNIALIFQLPALG